MRTEGRNRLLPPAHSRLVAAPFASTFWRVDAPIHAVISKKGAEDP
jgi:hypothetical protein